MDVFFGPQLTSPEKRKRSVYEQEEGYDPADDNEATVCLSPNALGRWHAAASATPPRRPSPSQTDENNLLVDLNTPSPNKLKAATRLCAPQQPPLPFQSDLMPLFSAKKPRQHSPKESSNDAEESKQEDVPGPGDVVQHVEASTSLVDSEESTLTALPQSSQQRPNNTLPAEAPSPARDPAPAASTSTSTSTALAQKLKPPMGTSKLPRAPGKSTARPHVQDTAANDSVVSASEGPSSRLSRYVTSRPARRPGSRWQPPRAHVPATKPEVQQPEPVDAPTEEQATEQVHEAPPLEQAQEASVDTSQAGQEQDQSMQAKAFKPKKTSLTTVQKVAQRLFAPGHFDEPPEPSTPQTESAAGQQQQQQQARTPSTRSSRPQQKTATLRVTPHPRQRSAQPKASTSTSKALNVAKPAPAPKPVPTAAAAAAASSAQNSKPSLTPAQLTHLTTQNTNINKRPYNRHSVVVIHKDEPRPPSPSAKMRKGTKEGRQNRALKRQATREGSELAVAAGEDDSDEGHEPHSSSAETHSKRVKWDKALVRDDSAQEAPHEPVGQDPVSAILVKTPQLDANGNVLNAKQPLSPLHPRQPVTITKLVYLDDE